MRLTPSERRAIERADRDRRQTRETDSLTHVAPIAYPDYPTLRTHPRFTHVTPDESVRMGAPVGFTTRAHHSSWLYPDSYSVRGRVIGYVDSPDGPQRDMVRVTRDGQTSLVSVRDLRETSEPRQAAQPSEARQPSEVARRAAAGTLPTFDLTGE